MVGWQSLADCTGLENRQGLTPFVGSNPTPTAKFGKSKPKDSG